MRALSHAVIEARLTNLPNVTGPVRATAVVAMTLQGTTTGGCSVFNVPSDGEVAGVGDAGDEVASSQEKFL